MTRYKKVVDFFKLIVILLAENLYLLFVIRMAREDKVKAKIL